MSDSDNRSARRLDWLPAEPLPETPDRQGAYPRLTEAQLRSFDELGERRAVARGDVVYREGEHSTEFVVLVRGQAVVVSGYDEVGDRDPEILRVHGPRRFLGELSIFSGQVEFVTTVISIPGEVIALPVYRARELVARDAEIGDLILRAVLARRSLLLGEAAGIRIVGSRFAPDTHRLRDFAARNRLPHRFVDIEADQEAERLVAAVGITPADLPVVVLGRGEVLRNPSTAELAAAIGLNPLTRTDTSCDLVVVGAGPAGLAAAVYGASDGLVTVVIDCVAIGGQAATSARIENYLGFPAGISGAELADRAAIQAARFGARISVPSEAVALEAERGRYLLRLDAADEVSARAVVIATGARYRKLDVPRLSEFEMTSVYYAATRFEAQQCATDPVAVVGGGNSAGQAAVFLARQSPSVHLIIRGGDLGKDMSRYLVEQVEAEPRIEVLRHCEVRELVGGATLEAVVVEDNRTHERRRIDARALFVFIGATPCTAWLAGTVALDADGFVLTGERVAGGERPHPSFLEASRPGVFAVGDVRSGSVKRVASAVGEGAMAVRLVHQHFG
jgi:thioredoxin reductase (NADPH)